MSVLKRVESLVYLPLAVVQPSSKAVWKSELFWEMSMLSLGEETFFTSVGSTCTGFGAGEGTDDDVQAAKKSVKIVNEMMWITLYICVLVNFGRCFNDIIA